MSDATVSLLYSLRDEYIEQIETFLSTPLAECHFTSQLIQELSLYEEERKRQAALVQDFCQSVVEPFDFESLVHPCPNRVE
ncbi:hypothetical protein ADEAN_000664700 [Angomonas deanei]|uniref:Uncharacterized protein n=1 Tax=Angomonas deanei TaxID=59799 RepID=A0A7G2CJN1_9TRYP|nr:hypothetical protein ADEAN_000664700 [Angomonas deanei]